MLHKTVGLLVCIFVGGLGAPGAVWADGAVCAMTNALGHNEIIRYHRAADGTLTLRQTIATGGGGSGIQLDPTDSLGSQAGLVLDRAHHRLFAVNTESFAEDQRNGTDIGDCHQGTISSFRVAPNGSLTLVDRIPSGGLFPDSLAIHEDVVYVLNAGGLGSIRSVALAPILPQSRCGPMVRCVSLPTPPSPLIQAVAQAVS